MLERPPPPHGYTLARPHSTPLAPYHNRLVPRRKGSRSGRRACGAYTAKFWPYSVTESSFRGSKLLVKVSDFRFGESDRVSAIRVQGWGEAGVLVELRGEFDQHNLEDLREALSTVLALRRPTLVDLAGVTFLDVGATRELAIRSHLYAHHLTLRNPSWQVRASVAACGFEQCLPADSR